MNTSNKIKKDRHRPGYYADYNKKRTVKGLSTDRHNPGYYRTYNLPPERIERMFGDYTAKVESVEDDKYKEYADIDKDNLNEIVNKDIIDDTFLNDVCNGIISTHENSNY